MFTNLIESDSHRKEFKRRSSFFLATVAAYALILSATGVASIYAYDAHLEAQTSALELLSWVPPVTRAPDVKPRNNEPIRRSTASSAPVDPNVRRPERTEFVSRTDDPNKIPDNIGVKAGDVPPITDGAVLSHRNVDPPNLAASNSGCATCNGTTAVVPVDDTTPPPVPVVVKPPTTARLTSSVLTSKAISLPQPPYPPLARQIHIQGAVTVQILVDEQGKVVSAHAVNGHPTLSPAAVAAALRARFTPTILSGQPVKVQGVITYNFVMQ